jgi:hypothetical protein
MFLVVPPEDGFALDEKIMNTKIFKFEVETKLQVGR